MDVFVSGLGVVSALGHGAEAQLEAFANRATGIATYEAFKGEQKHLGKLRLTNQELKELLGISQDDKIPRTALLGMLAAKQALGDTSSKINTGFINGTTTGGMDLTETYFQETLATQTSQLAENLKTHDLGTVTRLIQQHLGLKGYCNTISTACSSAANAIMMGCRMIQAGQLDRVLVGGVDALTDFTMYGFGSLMIYDKALCRPFDEQRVGLNLGEGAGYLLLENEKSLKETRNPKYARCTGWANANDAYHQTGTSPEGLGARKAMEEALNVADLSPDQIDYLNAHGTATKNNDNSEMAAIDKIFEGIDLDFSSTKGFTGHTLAAAGGIEAVYSVLGIHNALVFQNLNWENKMEQTEKLPLLETKIKPVTHVMSNSFGFGGNSTSLIFSKV